MEQATIHLWRKPAFNALLRSYKVILDGQKIGTIRHGKRTTFEVKPGWHQLLVMIDWCSSLPLMLSVKAGEEVHLVCQGPGFWSGFALSWFASGQYLKLYREQEQQSSGATLSPLQDQGGSKGTQSGKAKAISSRRGLSWELLHPDPPPLEQAEYWLKKGLSYENDRWYRKAELCYQDALALQEQELGPGHSETALTLQDLGRAYERQQKWDKVRPCLERARAIWANVEDPPYPDAVVNLGDLAAIYESQGEYEQAEPLYQRAVELTEQHQGLQHLDTAQALVSQALFYAHQGKYELARLLLEQVQVMKKKMPGADDAAFQHNLRRLRRPMKQETAEEK